MYYLMYVYRCIMYIQYNIYIYIHISTGPEFLNHELTGFKGHALNSCLLKKALS